MAGKSIGLGVYLRRTVLVIASRWYKNDDFKGLILDGVELRLSPEANYLGVILGQKHDRK